MTSAGHDIGPPPVTNITADTLPGDLNAVPSTLLYILQNSTMIPTNKLYLAHKGDGIWTIHWISMDNGI